MTVKGTEELHHMDIVKYVYFPVLAGFGGFGNRVSYHLTSSSRSGTSLSESLGCVRSPPKNFLINNFLNLFHALPILPFFIVRGGIAWDMGGGRGGRGGRDVELVGDRTVFRRVSSPDSTVCDTIGDIRSSKVEISRSSD